MHRGLLFWLKAGIRTREREKEANDRSTETNQIMKELEHKGGTQEEEGKRGRD